MINNLPVEVFIRILCRAFPSWQKLGCSNWHRALTYLRLVCRQWDRVVVSTQEFWTFYDFDLHEIKFPLHLLGEWLERSRGAMLEISLRESSRGRSTPAKDERHTNVLQTLGPHIPHCKTLRLRFGANFVPKLHALNFYRATSLKRICLTLLSEDNRDLEAVLQSLKFIPDLQELEWRAEHPNSISVMLNNHPLPWLDRLTRIEVAGQMTPNELLQVIHRCASAIDITVQKWPHPDGETHSALSSTITHFTLCFLHILFFNAAQYAVLRQLYLPNLRGFRYFEWSMPFVDTEAPAQVNLADLSDWMVNSTPSLEALRVNYTHAEFTYDQLRTFLHHPRTIQLRILELHIIHSFAGHSEDIPDIVEGCEGIKARFRMSQLVHGSRTMGWVDRKLLQEFHQDFPGSSFFTDLDPQLFS